MMFEDQLVSLNPAYSVEYEGGVYTVTGDPSYIDLTSKYGLDLLVLCGQNGVGKSTLLRIIENRNLPGDPEFNVVWKDKNGALISRSEESVIFDGSLIKISSMSGIDSVTALCANGAKQDKPNSFLGGFVEAYSHSPDVYDQVLGKKLFDGFYIGYEKYYSHFDQLEEEVSRKFGVDRVFSDFTDILRNHPTMQVLSWLCAYHEFDEDIKKIRARGTPSYKALYRYLADSESRAIDEEIIVLRQLAKEQNSDGKIDNETAAERIARINVKREESNRRYYDFAEYQKIRSRIETLSQKIGDWITSKFSQPRSHPGYVYEENFVWFKPYKRHADAAISGIQDLSNGEWLKLNMLFSLMPFLIQEDGCWFHFDDWDGELHPEWKRRFILELLTTYKKSVDAMRLVQGRPKSWKPRQTCVISTHSPFLLSDLLPQNILLLESKNGKTTIRRGDNPTFAGNIGELFHTEFFMDTTIGEFSRQAIKKVLRRLDKKSDQHTLESARQLFEKVGDEVLRNLLLEKTRNAKNQTN